MGEISKKIGVVAFEKVFDKLGVSLRLFTSKYGGNLEKIFSGFRVSFDQVCSKLRGTKFALILNLVRSKFGVSLREVW